jgi:predicted MPP superfamily phosphohydrolase
MISRRTFLFGVGAAVPLAVSAYGAGIEPHFAPRLASYRVSPPDWRYPDKVLRIGVIADIHACKPWMPVDQVEGIVAAANALEPDIFVLLGDFVEGLHGIWAEPIPMDHWAGPLQDLQAPLGTYAILGNHDWWVDAPATRAALEARQIPVMENDATLITADDGVSFWLGGLGDQLAFKATKTGVDDIEGLTARTPDDGRPAILLVHEPDIFPKVPPRFGLTLAGHTHGGQIRLPVLGRFPVASDYGQRYAYGHVVEHDRHIVISGGLGLSGMPMRVGVPPEINLIEVGSPEALALHHTEDRTEPA